MSGEPSERVQQAMDELYSTDPAGFTERRGELAAEARRSGDAVAAKQIIALRRPTASAWTLNALAHSQPDVIEQLLTLGEQLRQAEQDLDGGQLRELSRERRRVVESLARNAFTAVGQRTPSATVRDEVIVTLSAALADTTVGEQLRAGVLVRAAHWHGFGSVSPPGLSLVADTAATPAKAGSATTGSAKAAREAEAEAERQRQRRRAKAESELAVVAERLATAETAESEWSERVHQQQEQLAAAQRELDTARLDVRHARTKLDKVQEAVDELG